MGSKNKAIRNIFYLLIMVMAFSQSAWPQLWADLVLYNGKVLTADSENPANFTIAEAVSIYDGKFAEVGTTEEILKTAGPRTRRIDLEGRTVIPGRIDSHTHIQNYASRKYLGFEEGGLTLRSNLGMTAGILWTSKEDGLSQLRTIVMQKPAGEWVVVQPTLTKESGFPNLLAAFPPDFVKSLPMQELDRVAPNHFLVLSGYAYDDSLVNTKALETLLRRYPNIVGVERNPQGKPTGRLTGTASRTLALDFWPDDDPAWMAEGFRKYGEHYPAMGVTTVSSRIERNPLRAFQYLDARGALPVRVAYTSEAIVDHPDPEMLVRRYDTPPGAGPPMLWNTGFSLVNIDIVESFAGACMSKPYPRESREYPLWRFQFYGPNGGCMISAENHTLKAGIEAVVKHGGRLAGNHAAGDGAVDEFFDVIEPLAGQYDVKARRFGLDHCHAVRKDQVERAKKFDIAFSCQPPGNRRSSDEKEILSATEIIFGPMVGAEMISPFRSMVDAGLRPSLETDIPDYYSFLATEQLITRRFPGGRVIGPGQRINRREALYVSTRWAATYVLKEKELGSIEAGKWADLAVLDRDYLTIPEDEIHNIDVLMTILDGKIVYTKPDYAASKGLPDVGFRGDMRSFIRGRPEDLR